MDPDLAARPGHAARKQSRTCGQETAVFDPGAVDVGVRADQDVFADDHGVPGTAPDHGVFHDDAPRSDTHLPVLGSENRAEQHPDPRADTYRAADDRRRRDIGAGIDLRDHATMFKQHTPSVPAIELRAVAKNSPARYSRFPLPCTQ
jgi:hypothetical protein